MPPATRGRPGEPVRFVGVGKRFGEVEVLKEISLEVEAGAFLVLLGPSGCGKTTLLRLLAGLEEPTKGEIYVGERAVQGLAPKERDVAMVFQSYALYPHMTVFDNMAFGLRMRRVGRDEVTRRVEAAAHLLGLAHLLQRKPRALSGGQRQRVALGRAIVRNPKVFLMDEPLSNLDAKLRTATRKEIVRLQRRLGVTTLYVTHDQVEAMTMADTIALLHEGRIQQVGGPLDLYHHPANLFVASFIGSPAMNFFEGHVRGDRFVFGPHAVPFPQGGPGGKTTLGLRPEDVHLQPPYPGAPALRARVDVTEFLGDQTLLTLDAATTSLVAALRGVVRRKPGEELSVFLDLRKAHWFDDQGNRMEGRAQERPPA